MMSKIFNLFAVFSIGTVLAIGGFGVFLVLSDQLNASRAKTMAAVLRGEYDEPLDGDPNALVYVDDDEDGGTVRPVGARARSADEVRAGRRRDHMRNLMIERTRRDVEARQRLLDQTLQHVINEQENLAQQQNEWAERQREMTEDVQSQGFERELEYVASLPTKQAKEHIILTWNKHKIDAVRLFMQLDVSKGKRILKEFKTPDEMAIMSELLEQLRVQELGGEAAEPGKADGDATN
jgi:hypothetical protein